jgi:tRNA A37 threonylcarbamoyladenosine modification protein TsaB
VFYAFYRPLPGGVARETEYAVGTPAHLAAELDASREEVLLVGSGALVYGQQLAEAATPIEFASPSTAFPLAVSLLELALPRFHREEASRPEEILPLYVRKSDAEINWSRAGRVA